MRGIPLALVLALGPACGGSDEIVPDADHRVDARPPPPPGPFDALPLAEDIDVPSLGAPVHAARDRYGIMHIQAENVRDLGFAQGYVMAHDRLPQMDILRRFGDGTLGELFGAAQPSVIDTNLEMRVHRMRPLAEQAYATLQTSAASNSEDKKLVDLLQGFADGVNAANAAFASGKFPLDPAIAASFAPTTFRAWTPIDSLVLGRFQAFALSWTTPVELTLTDVYQRARLTFDGATAANPAAYARRGVSKNLLTVTPVGRFPTIDGWPNVGTDTGTRSDFGRPSTLQKMMLGALDALDDAPATAAATPAPAAAAAPRPYVPPQLLHDARAVLAPDFRMGPHSFMVPHAGSNDWVVGPSLAGGKTLLAGDQHLNLPNPSIFYPVQLTVPGEVDVTGMTFPGIPGIILGSNGKIAWSSTVVYHDVNDVFLENIAPCPSGGGDCVSHDGAPVRIEPWTETVKVGALGTITNQISATYEMVPHHGPIVPTVRDQAIVARTGNQALSVEYTGYQPTFEIRAVWGLAHAQTVDDAFKALHDFSYGGQNWVIIDNQGHIGWTSHAKVPIRKPAAYAWNAATNPGGAAPFFVLPGDGSADWVGTMSSRYIPHAIDPAAGFVATANSDPVGETFDDDPLDGPTVNGVPLYAGTTYAAGVRSERIAERIQAAAAAGPIDLDSLAAIQHDSRSNMGFHLRDAIVAALGYVADSTGAPPGVAAYVASLSSGDRTRLTAARAKLASWTFATPTGLATSATPQQLDDSTATAIFNVWMHYFIEDALGDEYTALGMSVWDNDDNLTARTVLALLVEPSGLVPSVTSGQPILCDGYTTAGADETCTQQVIAATLQALAELDTLMGSTDMAQWKWGKLHTLTLHPLFPDAQLDVPAPGSPQAGGYPKAGDNFAVNRADCGWGDLDFRQDADGPAQRFLAEAMPGQPIKMRLQFPGGTVYDQSSRHYKDVLENNYIAEQHFALPFTTSEIIAAGEDRWVFRP